MVKREEEAKKKEEMMSRMQKAKEYEKVNYT
jgi:hypothetical protein